MNKKPHSRWIFRIHLVAGVIVAWILIYRLERPDTSVQAVAHTKAPSNAPTDTRVTCTAPSEVPASAEPENLSGVAAHKKLQRGGEYESLGDALSAARLAIGKIDSAGAGSRGADYFAFNPGQRLQAWFSKDGVELASGSPGSDGLEPWSVALRLRGIGRDNSLTPVSTGTTSSEGSRVEMGHPNVAATQWFENRKEGLEQGFTLERRPEGSSNEVTISLSIEGSLHGDRMASGHGIRLRDSSGIEKVHYDGLKAWDATGRELDTRMELAGPTDLHLIVRDSNSIYPLTIDPLFANVEARLVQSSDNDNLGSSVALSGDTALIGVPGEASAYIFVRSGTVWTKQAQLAAVDDRPFGNSIALSGDTALVGAQVFVRSGTVWVEQATLVANDGASLVGPVALDGNTAMVGPYVFVRTGAVWSQQTKLISSNGAALDGPVALSGNTALVSAALVSGNRMVHVYIRVGNVWSLQATLNATGLSTGDFYGGSLALSADTALVGAPNQTTDILGEGSVYFFKRSGTTWTSQGKLSGFTDGDSFGASIAVSGDTALIGGPGIFTETATIVARSGAVWSRQTTLNAPDGLLDSGFGSSVALSGNTALVGAPSADTSTGKDAGSAFAFLKSGTAWSLQSDFKIDDAPSDDRSGNSVSISGDTALVGAPDDGFVSSPNFSPALGCAYVFVRRGLVWTPQAKLTNPGAGSTVDFGVSVALSGHTALIGAPDGGGGGNAYVFVRSGAVWNQQAKLTPSAAAGSAYFGGSVALSGETALVGAYLDDTPVNTNAGSAYVFVRKGVTWTEQAKLHAPDGADRDIFGFSVAISGDTALVGSLLDDTPAGTDSGSAFVFRRFDSTWKQEAKLLAGDAAPADFFGGSVAIAGGSFVSTTAWQNIPLGSRSGLFSLKFQITPQAAPMNGVSGLALGSADDITDLACAVRLNPAGHFDVSKGSGFDAAKQVSYVAGKSYEVEMTVNTSSSTFSVAIDGVLIAENFSFRSEKAGTTRFDTLAIINETGSHIVSNYGQVTALIGSTGDDTAAGTEAGSACVFVRDEKGWSQQAKLTAGDAVTGDQFGNSVALEGDTAFIGAYTSDTVAGSDTGSGYVFVRYGTLWNQELKLTAGVDASPNDQFGRSVALSGSTAVVGAPFDDTVGTAAGSTYTFLLGELPSITQQPVSKTVLPERLVSFNIKATGYGPLRYQWRKSGSLLAGEIGTTFTIASAQVIDQGDYDCVVSNVGGVVTSAAARLNVNALSEFTQSFPVAAPDAQGFVFVTLSPPGIGNWRFEGEQLWRPSGVPVGGLATGDRNIEFRPVPGYLQPPPEIVGVVSGGAASIIDRFYYKTSGAGTGKLAVTLKPDALAGSDVPVADRAQWRLLGADDSQWRDSGATLGGLAAGNYLVECKPIAGRTTPPPGNVRVVDSKTSAPTLTYFLTDPITGTLPALIPFETVTTDETKPFAYVGQIRSNAGLSTGFVVKPRVVATAGHVVFDDGTLAAVGGLQWHFQRHSGTFEPKPLAPRGFYIFDGYAAQRTLEKTPGSSTPASQTLDAASIYFLEDAGRGGFGGFLASDALDNEFLLSSADKTLVGYPVDGILPVNQGRMHATPPVNISFSRAFGKTYTTSTVRSAGGTSGGPLCIQFEDGPFYPAAIYLGGTGQTVVRAIDGEVIDLFNRAEVSGNGGDNNTGGGITHSDFTAFGATTQPGAIVVTIQPAAARNTGAGWRLKPETSYRASGSQKSGLSAGNYQLQFSTVGGFQVPTPQTVTVKGGQLQQVTFTYAGAPLIAIEQPDGTILQDGVSSFSFDSVVMNSSVTRSFTIRNLGRATLKNLKVTLDGKDSVRFKVTQPAKSTLAPGANETFDVTFAPTAKGKSNAAIHITSNDATQSPFDIKLTGAGASTTAASGIAPLPSWTDLYAKGILQGYPYPAIRVTPSVVTLPDGNRYRALKVEKTPVGKVPTVEVSSNLMDWYSGDKHTTVLINDLLQLKVRDNTPFTQEKKRFIRASPP